MSQPTPYLKFYIKYTRTEVKRFYKLKRRPYWNQRTVCKKSSLYFTEVSFFQKAKAASSGKNCVYFNSNAYISQTEVSRKSKL